MEPRGETGRVPALCPEPVPVIRTVTDEHLSSLCFCSFTCRQLSWGPCRNAGFDSLSPEGDLSVFISSKFPSDADAAGPRPSAVHCLIAVVTSPSGQWFVRSFPRGRASLTRERSVPWKSLPLPLLSFWSHCCYRYCLLRTSWQSSCRHQKLTRRGSHNTKVCCEVETNP